MSDRIRFITLHDTYNATKRKPQGRVMRVAVGAIDTMRPYNSGVTRTVLGINGSFMHVAETETQILDMIHGYIAGGHGAPR